MANVIFALVGPSRSGKSALIEEMLRRFPDCLMLMRSLTTRSRRATDDDRSTRFVSKEEFLSLQQAGGLVQWVEYDGNFYGDARDDIKEIFAAGKHGIRPLIEEAVKSFRAQRFRVAMARITPSGQGYKNRSKGREVIDAKRAQESLAADVEIANCFEPGGFEAACSVLAAFIGGEIGSRGRE